MRYLITLLAVFAILLTMEAPAMCQTQEDKRESELAKEASNEEKAAVEPVTKLPEPSDSLPSVTPQFNKAVVITLDKDTNVPELGKRTQSQTQWYDSAQSPTMQAAQQQQPAGNLAQDVTDPTAPLTTLTFQNRYVPSLWGIDDHLNEFSLQLALPYKLGGRPQIFRAIIPYFTDTPSPENRGVGDISLANITIFPKPWGAFAVGGVASLGTNKGPGRDTFAVGPAVAAITKRGKWIFGFLNQNLFSFGGDIKISQIQPIVSYTLNKKVSFAIGDAQHTIDWNQGEFVAVPLSIQANYIAMLGKQPIRLFINPQYNVLNSFGQRKWTIGFGFALLLR